MSLADIILSTLQALFSFQSSNNVDVCKSSLSDALINKIILIMVYKVNEKLHRKETFFSPYIAGAFSSDCWIQPAKIVEFP